MLDRSLKLNKDPVKNWIPLLCVFYVFICLGKGVDTLKGVASAGNFGKNEWN